MALLKVNNANIYYETHGKGQQCLVLIAGFGCNHTFWGPLVENLKNDFQMLILDNRGSGQTQNGNEDITIQMLAEDVMAIVNFLGWEKPDVIGHSMGGTIAQNLAITYANSIGKIMLFNTAAKLNAICLMALSNALKLQKANVPFDLLIEEFIPWVFSEEFVLDSIKLAKYKKTVKEYPYPQTIKGNEQQIRALEVFDSRMSLNRIKSETLIVGNERDLFIGEKELKFLKDNIINSNLMLLPGGHATLMEKIDITADVVRKFLLS